MANEDDSEIDGDVDEIIEKSIKMGDPGAESPPEG
jgi:hypothetical protein